jgi:hypothetical protein
MLQGTWAFSAASLSTTVAWSGANVDATDGYINTSELSTATVTGKVANPNGITDRGHFYIVRFTRL